MRLEVRRHDVGEGGGGMDQRGTIFIVDEPAETRGPLASALALERLVVEYFSGTEDLLGRLAGPAKWPCCVVAGARLPEDKNLELQVRLFAQGLVIPVIQRAGVGEVSVGESRRAGNGTESLGAMQNVEALLERIESALELSVKVHRWQFQSHEISCRLDRLTIKETDVWRLLLRGKTSKEVAIELSISIPTVAKYRKKILEKFKVRNVVELVQLIASFSAVCQAQRTHDGTEPAAVDTSVERLLHDLVDERAPRQPHTGSRQAAIGS
jgi:FixJ family two-component response regulator